MNSLCPARNTIGIIGFQNYFDEPGFNSVSNSVDMDPVSNDKKFINMNNERNYLNFVCCKFKVKI